MRVLVHLRHLSDRAGQLALQGPSIVQLLPGEIGHAPWSSKISSTPPPCGRPYPAISKRKSCTCALGTSTVVPPLAVS